MPHPRADLPLASRRRALCLGLGGMVLSVAGPLPRLALAQAPAAVATAGGGAADIWWLDRLTWGATPDGLAELRRQGRDAWLSRQLAPTPGPVRLPAGVAASIAQLDISRTSLQQRMSELEAMRPPPKRQRAQAGAERMDADMDADKGMGMGMGMAGAKAKPADADAEVRRRFRRRMKVLGQEAQYRALLRAAYAPNQLHEQMVWFWMNHFSINGREGLLQAFLPDYEDRAIRPHALGRFRDLLEAVVTHPAMLIYLNNNTNAAGRINENLARELMELHTLGVDGGYTQADVQSLARVLTGLGVDRQGADDDRANRRPKAGTVTRVDGFTVFTPARHETGTKVLLGQPLPGEGWAEIQAMLDRLASHPSTARHVARQLARHFVGDAPPEALLNRMAKRFQDTGGQMAEVVRVMATAPEFEQSLDRRFKLPVQYVVSAWRLLWPDGAQAPEARRALGWLERLGQPMYSRSTPDGFPAEASYWNGSGQMTARFELAQQWAALAGKGSAGENPDAWLAPTLSTQTRETLGQAKSPQDRLAWLLSSPEFMTR